MAKGTLQMWLRWEYGDEEIILDNLGGIRVLIKGRQEHQARGGDRTREEDDRVMALGKGGCKPRNDDLEKLERQGNGFSEGIQSCWHFDFNPWDQFSNFRTPGLEWTYCVLSRWAYGISLWQQKEADILILCCFFTSLMIGLPKCCISCMN